MPTKDNSCCEYGRRLWFRPIRRATKFADATQRQCRHSTRAHNGGREEALGASVSSGEAAAHDGRTSRERSSTPRFRATGSSSRYSPTAMEPGTHGSARLGPEMFTTSPTAACRSAECRHPYGRLFSGRVVHHPLEPGAEFRQRRSGRRRMGGTDDGRTFSVNAVNADGTPHHLPKLVLTRGARRLAFLGGDDRLVILNGDISHKEFWVIDLDTGRERQVTNLGRGFTIGDFDVCRGRRHRLRSDARRVGYCRVQPGPSINRTCVRLNRLSDSAPRQRQD
jgi:hypothetical protein